MEQASWWNVPATVSRGMKPGPELDRCGDLRFGPHIIPLGKVTYTLVAVLVQCHLGEGNEAWSGTTHFSRQNSFVPGVIPHDKSHKGRLPRLSSLVLLLEDFHATGTPCAPSTPLHSRTWGLAESVSFLQTKMPASLPETSDM